jgi:hypothetical protein
VLVASLPVLHVINFLMPVLPVLITIIFTISNAYLIAGQVYMQMMDYAYHVL